MLKKLIKYDLQTLLTLCSPVYLVGLVLTVTNGVIMRVSYELNLDSLSSDFMMLLNSLYTTFMFFSYFLVLMILPATGIIFATHLFKHVFSQEGYLTNTLPVTPSQIVLGKVLSGLVVGVLSSLAMGILYSLFFSLVEPDFWMYVGELFEDLAKHLDFEIIGHVLLWILVGIVSLVCNVLHITASFALGHLTRYKVIMSLVAYGVIYNFIIQPIMVISLFLVDDSLLDALFFFGVDDIGRISLMWAGSCLAMQTILSAIFFFISTHIISRKLNMT